MIEQGYLFSSGVVNVSKVKHLSPLRYPGGKTWLVPVVREWLTGVPKRPHTLLESFAGGATVSLTAVNEGLVDRAVLVELDDEVADMWDAIINGHPSDVDALRRRLVEFNFTPESVDETVSASGGSSVDRAVRTIVKNRARRGGVMAPGAGFMRSGDGRGIASRWYPETIARRVGMIFDMRDRLTVIRGDGLAEVEAHSGVGFAHFIDPPYTASGKRAGRRLYLHNEVAHDALFAAAAAVEGPVMLTYDDTEWTRGKAAEYGMVLAEVAMQSAHLVKMTELVVVSPG